MNLRNTVLLFYEPTNFDFDPNYPNRTMSGFFAWQVLLIRCLEKQGLKVILNSYRIAEDSPLYPIGIVGHPHILRNWHLKNPAILGPSMYDHPKLNPGLMNERRFKYYLVTCEWFQKMFQPYYGDKCVLWHAAIDTDMWPDTKQRAKTIDVLVYDKLRWDRDRQISQLREPILNFLQQGGLSYEILRYGNYSHEEYRALLEKSRAMLFLCEHETQGMGYQEALASNVPVLAWDPGYWSAPQRSDFESNPVPATSVPYFSDECGETFRDIGEFATKFTTFWNRLHNYRPRTYVETSLSMAGSADLYLRYYFERMV